MKALQLLFLSVFVVSGCKERPIVQDLGNGFSISGMKSRGIYTIKKDGIKAARIDLQDEYLVYSAYKSGSTMTGHLSTPLNDSSGRGCMAIISFVNPDGKLESHQVIERRILGGGPSKDDVVIGAAVYNSNKAEQVVAPNDR